MIISLSHLETEGAVDPLYYNDYPFVSNNHPMFRYQIHSMVLANDDADENILPNHMTNQVPSAQRTPFRPIYQINLRDSDNPAVPSGAFIKSAQFVLTASRQSPAWPTWGVTAEVYMLAEGSNKYCTWFNRDSTEDDRLPVKAGITLGNWYNERDLRGDRRGLTICNLPNPIDPNLLPKANIDGKRPDLLPVPNQGDPDQEFPVYPFPAGVLIGNNFDFNKGWFQNAQNGNMPALHMMIESQAENDGGNGWLADYYLVAPETTVSVTPYSQTGFLDKRKLDSPYYRELININHNRYTISSRTYPIQMIGTSNVVVFTFKCYEFCLRPWNLLVVVVWVGELVDYDFFPTETGTVMETVMEAEYQEVRIQVVQQI